MENGMRQIDLPEFTVTAKKKLERIENDFSFPEPDLGVPFEEIKNNPPRTYEDLFYRISGVKDLSEKGISIVSEKGIGVVSEKGISIGTGYATIIFNGIPRDYSFLLTMVDISEIPPHLTPLEN